VVAAFVAFATSDDALEMATRRYRSLERPSGVDALKGVQRNSDHACNPLDRHERNDVNKQLPTKNSVADAPGHPAKD
jgi:hypothetical protein